MIVSRSWATLSTASTATDPAPVLINVGRSIPASTTDPSKRTSVTVNFGDQSRPPREPLSPGRPTQPVQCSGRTETRTGSSTRLAAIG